MSKLRVHCFSLSFDGYGAGPDQDVDNPLGVGGEALHGWFVATRTFKQVFGKPGGVTGPDDDLAARGVENIGAWILGRNMFGPVRGSWPDNSWKGWWGEEPPYRVEVFVLTHHPRAPIAMKGGTTFHFVTDGIHARLRRRAKPARRGQPDRARRHPGLAAVHVPGATPQPEGRRRSHGHLVAGGRAPRAAHWTTAVPGGQRSGDRRQSRRRGSR